VTRQYLPRRGGLILAQIGVTVLFFVLWEYAANHNVIDPFFFSKPSAIWHYLTLWGSNHQPASLSTGTTLWQDLEATAIVFGIGYAIGTVAGILTGILLGTVGLAREIAEPFLVFMNAMPRLILLPVLVVIFGFGYFPQILLVILVIYFVVTVQITTGIQETPINLLNNARALGASKMNLVRTIYVPSLMLWILSTTRVVIGFAIQAAIASEFIGAARGLGFRFTDAQVKFRSDEMFASFAVVLVLALVVDVALSLVERRATRWMPAYSR
jgi:NitT/TauT family transport system permease protein